MGEMTSVWRWSALRTSIPFLESLHAYGLTLFRTRHVRVGVHPTGEAGSLTTAQQLICLDTRKASEHLQHRPMAHCRNQAPSDTGVARTRPGMSALSPTLSEFGNGVSTGGPQSNCRGPHDWISVGPRKHDPAHRWVGGRVTGQFFEQVKVSLFPSTRLSSR